MTMKFELPKRWTKRAIKTYADSALAQVKEIGIEFNAAKQRLQAVQQICPHPDGFINLHYDGSSTFYCPDCHLDR